MMIMMLELPMEAAMFVPRLVALTFTQHTFSQTHGVDMHVFVFDI